MDKYILNLDCDETPKYIKIAEHIKSLIDDGKIDDGEKLPTIRALSNKLSVNNITVINAYKRLQSEGYAVLKIGSGTYAKKKEMSRNYRREYSNAFRKLPHDYAQKYIDFSGETASSGFFEVSIFKNVIDEVLNRDGSDALIYQEELGYEGLRKSINKYFWDGKMDDENILIVSGAQQGIDVVSKALIGINDNVIVERPTYSGALSVFKWRRANIFEADMLADGIDIDQFEKILKKNDIKCFYSMSYFQNPTAMSYSLDKKKKIIEMADYYDFYIIEDDYLSELIYDNNIKYLSYKNLDKSDRVIYIKSFSKIFLPGIRLGYVLCPSKFEENIENMKVNTDISTSSLMQRVLDLYIDKGLWRKHIKNLNVIYNDKYNIMEKYLNAKFNKLVEFISPGGGLNFYLRILNNVNIDCMELFYRCLKKNVIITPGVLFYKSPEEGKKYFKLSFSQVQNDDIEKGLNLLLEILKSCESK